MNPRTRTPSTVRTVRRTPLRIAGVSLAALGLGAAGAGVAAAAAPTSTVGAAVTTAVDALTDWSSMPEGYTQEEYEAFWGAGYTPEDVDALGALWGTDTTETKARAGQLLLDGEPVPVAPGATAPVGSAGEAGGEDAMFLSSLDAYFDAGYTYDDAVVLSGMWNLDIAESKAQAGQLLLDGQPVPVAPSGTPAAAGE